MGHWQLLQPFKRRSAPVGSSDRVDFELALLSQDRRTWLVFKEPLNSKRVPHRRFPVSIELLATYARLERVIIQGHLDNLEFACVRPSVSPLAPKGWNFERIKMRLEGGAYVQAAWSVLPEADQDFMHHLLAKDLPETRPMLRSSAGSDGHRQT